MLPWSILPDAVEWGELQTGERHEGMFYSLVTFVRKVTATMTVETRYVEIGSGGDVDFSQARPAARTIIKLDGDSETIIPVRKPETGESEADTVLFDLHQSNVTTAIDYRASMLDALLGTLKSGIG